MADTLVEGNPVSDTELSQGLWGPYWISTSVGVIVGIDSGNDASFWRTDDSGNTWNATEIHAGDTQQMACWFDQETPGDSGTLVNVAWLDSV